MGLLILPWGIPGARHIRRGSSGVKARGVELPELLFVAIKHVRDSRRVRHVIPVLLAASLILLESWIRRGHPFTSGYEGNAGLRTLMPYSGQPGFSYHYYFGLLSITLSYGKGILFFAPGLLLKVGVPLGRLPGDITIRRGGGSFYFPVVTCILISIVLSVLASLLRR